MRDKFLPFALPDIGEEEIAEVVDSMRSGWLTTGPKTKAFEHDFADYIGGGVAAMAVSSAWRLRHAEYAPATKLLHRSTLSRQRRRSFVILERIPSLPT